MRKYPETSCSYLPVRLCWPRVKQKAAYRAYEHIDVVICRLFACTQSVVFTLHGLRTILILQAGYQRRSQDFSLGDINFRDRLLAAVSLDENYPSTQHCRRFKVLKSSFLNSPYWTFYGLTNNYFILNSLIRTWSEFGGYKSFYTPRVYAPAGYYDYSHGFWNQFPCVRFPANAWNN